MPYFAGEPYTDGVVAIGPPDLQEIARVVRADDVRTAVDFYLRNAPIRADITYFSILLGERVVGQIMLHDINWLTGESLVGYHLFATTDRGRGIGTRALTLVQQYVVQRTRLTQLTIITSSDNSASQRLARNGGFSYAGPAREDASLLVFRWEVPQQSNVPE